MLAAHTGVEPQGSNKNQGEYKPTVFKVPTQDRTFPIKVREGHGMAGMHNNRDNVESQNDFESDDPASCASHNMVSTSSDRDVLKLPKCDNSKSSEVVLSTVTLGLVLEYGRVS